MTHEQFGDFYMVGERSTVSASHLDLELTAKNLGVLKPWERLEKP